MMKVCYSELDGPEGLSCRLEAAGHAGFAPAGQDIVCAGASTLMQALVYLLAGEENAHADAWEEPDGPRLAVQADAPCAAWVQGAFELAKAGFTLLAERYPDNIRFADVSRRGEQSMMDLQMFAEEAAPAAPALSRGGLRFIGSFVGRRGGQHARIGYGAGSNFLKYRRSHYAAVLVAAGLVHHDQNKVARLVRREKPHKGGQPLAAIRAGAVVGLLSRAGFSGHQQAVHAGALARTVLFFHHIAHHVHDLTHGGFGIDARVRLHHPAVVAGKTQGLEYAVVEQSQIGLRHLQPGDGNALPKGCGQHVHFTPVSRLT